MVSALQPFSKVLIQTCIYISIISYIYKKEANKPDEKTYININNLNLKKTQPAEIDELEKTIHPDSTDSDSITETEPDYEKSIINSNEFSNISSQEANEEQRKSAETGHRACSFYALGEYLFRRKN